MVNNLFLNNQWSTLAVVIPISINQNKLLKLCHVIFKYHRLFVLMSYMYRTQNTGYKCGLSYKMNYVLLACKSK